MNKENLIQRIIKIADNRLVRLPDSFPESTYYVEIVAKGEEIVIRPLKVRER